MIDSSTPPAPPGRSEPGTDARALLAAVYEGRDTASAAQLVDWRNRLKMGLANLRTSAEKAEADAASGTGYSLPGAAQAVFDAYLRIVWPFISDIEALVVDLEARIGLAAEASAP